MTHACKRRPLAVGELAIVEQCSCAAVHLTIGAVTLRLAAGAIASLAETLHEAALQLALEATPSDRTARGEILS